MTQRIPHGYQHANAYRTWLPEHIELLQAIALKGRGYAALSSTTSLESIAVCLGRSETAVAKIAAKMQLCILTRQQLEIEWAQLEALGQTKQ